MANLIDLDSKRKLSYYFDFETRTLNVLKLMESIFGPPPINPVNIEDSLINENWPRFNVISDFNFTVNSLPVPRILSGVNVKPTGVIKLFCDHPNLTWNHLTIIPPRPLTGITKGPQYAVIRNFVNSIQADMNFSHCLSPYCFLDQIITSCMGLLIKMTVAHLGSYGNRQQRFFRFIKQGTQNLVRFHFIYRYSFLRTLLRLPRGFYRIKAAWSPRT